MRAVHIHRIAGIGGSERHLLTLLPALREHGVDPILIGLDDPAGAPAPFYEALDASGVRTIRLQSRGDFDPQLARELVRAIRVIQPDVVHTHLVHADVYGALAATLSGTPLVSTKHNDDPFRTGPFRVLERVLARRARKVIVITEALRQFNVHKIGLPARKLAVVHYGLDVVPKSWGQNPRVEIPDGSRVLLAVSRLAPQKGIDVAVAAMPKVRAEHPTAVLVVAGEGPERERLVGQARRLGVADAVFLPGRAGDVAGWLASAELLVHPARWEGFGLVLLEAMLAARPIVATSVSAIPEIVVDGETGVLVPPDDADALAAAVNRVLGDRELAGRLGSAGLERARSEFSVARMARRTAAVYREAASTPSAHDSTE